MRTDKMGSGFFFFFGGGGGAGGRSPLGILPFGGGAVWNSSISLPGKKERGVRIFGITSFSQIQGEGVPQEKEKETTRQFSSFSSDRFIPVIWY